MSLEIEVARGRGPASVFKDLLGARVPVVLPARVPELGELAAHPVGERDLLGVVGEAGEPVHDQFGELVAGLEREAVDAVLHQLVQAATSQRRKHYI